MLYQNTRHEAINASDDDLIFECMDSNDKAANELARRYSFVLAKLAALKATMDTIDPMLESIE